VLNSVDTLLAQAGLCTVWPSNMATPFWDMCRSNRSVTCFDAPEHCVTSAYVDDYSAIAPLDISSDSVVTLIDNITVMPIIVSEVLHTRGMNLNAAKSGIMLTLAGKDSVQAKKVLANTQHLVIHGRPVPVVLSYNLLGGTIDRDAVMGPEIKARGAQAGSLSAPFRQHIVPKASLSTSQTVQVIDSIIVSSLLYNAHTWCHLSKTDIGNIDKKLATVYASAVPKRLVRVDDVFVKLTDNQVSSLVRRHDAEHQIRRKRLLFLPRILLQGCPALIQAIDATADIEGSFSCTIRDDLLWMRKHTDKVSTLDDPRQNITSWLHFALSKEWKNSVSQAYHDSMGDYHDRLRLRQLHRTIASMFLPHFAPPAFVKESAQPAACTQYICYECGHVSDSKKAWAQHRKCVHKFVLHSRFYAPDSICRCCLRDFHTMPRIIRHLEETSPQCLAVLEYNLDIIDNESIRLAEVRRIKESQYARARGYHPYKAFVPPVSVPGLQLTAPAWCDEVQQSDYSTPFAIQEAQTSAPLQSLQQSQAKPLELSAFSSCSHVHSVIKLKTKLVLHLFSGQRRPGDYQDHLESCFMQREIPASNVVVLSIDIVIHRLGDLTNPEALKLWIDLTLAGVVLVILGGPPCETWTAVRYKQLVDEQGQPKPGPRPLRSAQSLWGDLRLTKHERKSVELGNALLRAVITLFYAATRTCRTAVIMEHPKKPYDHSYPSSFKLPELMCIEEHCLGDAVHIDQCAFDAPSQKPTTLLTFNLPHLRRVVNADFAGGKCTHASHERTLSGCDEHGKFLTAPAKQYTSKLNMCLASASCKFLYDNMHIQHESPSESFQEHLISKFYVPLDPYCAEQSLGHFGNDRSELSGQAEHIALQSAPHTFVKGAAQRREDLIKESRASLYLSLEPSLHTLALHANTLASTQSEVPHTFHDVPGDHSASILTHSTSILADTSMQGKEFNTLPCVFCCELVCVCDSNVAASISVLPNPTSCACGEDHPISLNGHSSIDADSTSTIVISTRQRERIEANRHKALAIKRKKRIAALAAWPTTHLPAFPVQNEHVAPSLNSQNLTRHKSPVRTNSACTPTG
jgi:hypothetical protein